MATRTLRPFLAGVGIAIAAAVLGAVYPGFQTTGTPAAGNLAKFSAPGALTNGDLSGDCTTSGALAVTCTKTSGVAFAPIATSGSASDLSAGTTTVARGGTGLGTLTSHGLVVGEGTASVGSVAAMAADTLLQGQGTSSDPAAVTLSNCGDSTHALAYSTSTHLFSCQSITGSGGTITTTGSPASGNLAKFSGANSVTNGDLSGDCTTSGTLSITCTKTSGVAFAAVATSGSASDLTTGTLGAARLPNPAASTLGGIESLASVAHKWINAISTLGVPSATQPACGDLSDSVASCNTDATNATNITSGTLAIAQGGTGNSSIHKSFGFFNNGVQPSASYRFLYIVPPQSVTVPSGAGSSTCVAGTAATGSTTLTVKKNGSAVGTAVWAASGTSCSYTWSSSTSWNGTTDVMEIVGPATPDATLADFSVILNPTTTAP